jgi:hypothetical protein
MFAKTLQIMGISNLICRFCAYIERRKRLRLVYVILKNPNADPGLIESYLQAIDKAIIKD